MDMVKMGSFLAELRKEHHLTQAELGETNIKETLKEGTFTLKEKQAFFKKKWLKEHAMTIVIAYMVEKGMSIKREKNNLTFPQKKNIITSERVAKLRKSSFAARFCNLRE